MRIVTLIAASAAALTLAACNNNAEEKAPDAASEAVEASGIAGAPAPAPPASAGWDDAARHAPADQSAVTVTEEQAAADAKAAADAAAASEVAQTEPAAPAATPVEGH